MVKKNFRADPELEGKLLPMPDGIYDKGQAILNMLRSDGELQKPDNYMYMVLKWGFGSLLDYLHEYHDKISERKFLYGLLNIDDCKYGYNCPANLSELIAKGNQIDIKVDTDKLVTFYEYYNDEVILAGSISFKEKIIGKTISTVTLETVDDENYLYFTFLPKLIHNPNYKGEPEGYDPDGNAYEYINLDDYPSDFVPDGYDGEGNPYLFINDFEPEYKEEPISPIYFKVSDIDSNYNAYSDNYPFEKLLNQDGSCQIDEDAQRITTWILDEYGREYDVPRLPNESNQDYARRLVAYSRDVSSICGFRDYVATLLDITQDDIYTEYLFLRLKTFDTHLRDGETETEKASYAINRIKTDNVKGQNDEEADVTVSRDAGQVSNQLVLKLTIPCNFDLKWVYNQLVELLPIGVLLEVWDQCGNYYPSIFNIDLLMATNLHLLKGQTFSLNKETKIINDEGKFIENELEGDFFEFLIPSYHEEDTRLEDNQRGNFAYNEYISRDIEGVMMINPMESFVLQLLIKCFKKNEYMFHDI